METKSQGVIYILTNPSFPDYVKIGYADDVNKRLKEFKVRNNADKFFRNTLDNDDAEEALLSYLNNIIYNEARKKIEEYTKEANDLNEQD